MDSSELKASLLEILDEAIQADHAKFGNIQIFNPRRGGLEILAQRGFDEEFLEAFRLVRVNDDSACGRAFRFGQRVVIPDITADPYFAPYVTIASRAGYRAVQSTAILGPDANPIGVLSTHFPKLHRLSRQATIILDRCALKIAMLIQSSNP